MTKNLITACLLSAISCNMLVAQDTSAIAIAGRVADKVIRDASFAFRKVLRKEQLGMQVIDLRPFQVSKDKAAFATRRIKADTGGLVKFGISGGGNIQVWINGKLVFVRQQDSLVVPAEIAYGRFNFSQYFAAHLEQGYNEIVIGYVALTAAPVVFLRAVNDLLDADASINFNADPAFPDWKIWVPALRYCDVGTPQHIIDSLALKAIEWQLPPQQYLYELVIDEKATYQRDSYTDWNYPNGATLWSMMAIDEVTNGDRYLTFVKKYSDFVLTRLPYFKLQYDSLFAWRGSFHRIFRQSMLDDSGTPALPLLELYLKQRDSSLNTLLDPIADYVSNGQVRLPDGTFCRPEPVSYTVWADDLFMSVPFLLRMGRSTGDQKYYDDAARQVVQFNKYLLDKNTGLYKHGWFSNTGKQSVAYWGRANGWVVWATTELLTWLPQDHPQYKTILKLFKAHIGAIAKYQEKNGMWHQLINRQDSYEETSCTALFTLAMARGVRKGWLPERYRKKAMAGWLAVKKQIDADGTVHGICRGTEIGMDEAYYRSRPTIDHDPRGLGAVITAAVEIAKLQ